MLVFPCPSCGAKLQMSDEMAGKKVRCGSCQSVTTAPETAAAAAAAITSDPAPPRPAKADRDRDEDVREGPPRRARSDTSDGVKAAATGMGVGAIVAIAVGVVGCLGCGGVALMMALLVPAVQKVREAAARTQTMNNMKQIAMAEHNFHDTFRFLSPPKMLKPPQHQQSTELSWRVAILPFIEQQNLFTRFDTNLAWDNPRNQMLLNPLPMVYQDIGREGAAPPGSNTHFQYFTGPNTLWPDNNKRTLIMDIPDGTSNTILFAEAAAAVPWTQPLDMAVQPNQPLPLPPARFLAAMADGSVRMVVRPAVSDATLRLAIDPRDGRPLPADWN